MGPSKGWPPAEQACQSCLNIAFHACDHCCKCQPRTSLESKVSAGRWCKKCAYKRGKKLQLVESGALLPQDAPCDCTPKRKCLIHFSVHPDCSVCDVQFLPRACADHCLCKVGAAASEYCATCKDKGKIAAALSKSHFQCGCGGICPLCCICSCGGQAPCCSICSGSALLTWVGDSYFPSFSLPSDSCTGVQLSVDVAVIRLYVPGILQSVKLTIFLPRDYPDVQVQVLCPLTDQLAKVKFGALSSPQVDRKHDNGRPLYSLDILPDEENGRLGGGIYSIRFQGVDGVPLPALRCNVLGMGMTGWSTIELPPHVTFTAWKSNEEMRLGGAAYIRRNSWESASSVGEVLFSLPLSSGTMLEHYVLYSSFVRGASCYIESRPWYLVAL
jgi:hypothetical protein